MFKSSFQIPLGSEAGQITIELPMAAFQNDEKDQNDGGSEDPLAAFSSKITASVLKLAKETVEARRPAKRTREESPGPDSPRSSKKKRLDADSDSSVLQATTIEEASAMKQNNIVIELRDWERSVSFRLAPTTELRKAFQTFSRMKGRDISTLRFYHDGAKARHDDTPDSVSGRLKSLHPIERKTNHSQLAIEDGDVINVYTNQTGS